MGSNCCSEEDKAPEERERERLEKENSKFIENVLKESCLADKKKMKLLLLGAGDSGKSTLVKQMTTIYKKGFSEFERKGFYPALCNNIICSMRILCKQSVKFGPIESQNEKYKKQIMDLDSNWERLTDGVGEAIEELWKDEGIQATYTCSSQFYLSDSSTYFFSKLPKVKDPKYIPSLDDVFRIRISTTGIIQNNFSVEGHDFQMFDVGGQRSERKKWIHCFENVTSVIFVAALSAYDQVLYEDEGINRLQESLDLFTEITGLSFFTNTAFILFLNKKDLFQEKLGEEKISQYWPTYTQWVEEKKRDDFEGAAEFITDLFVKNYKGDIDMYTHLTCATDTQNVEVVFTSVKDIVVRRGLMRAGIV